MMPYRTALSAFNTERRPLVITSDPRLLDDLLRVAAAAGVDVDVAPDGASARRLWPAAPLIVIGTDAVGSLRGEATPERPGLVIVRRAGDDGVVPHDGPAFGAATLTLPIDEAALSSRFADTAERSGGPAPIVGIIGGCGGAGASTFAAGLAVAAAQRFHTTLVDADPLAGGIDLLLGGEAVDGLRWSALANARGRISGAALDGALPQVASIRVLSCDSGRAIPADAMGAVLDAARRLGGVVIIDLPRRTDAAAVEALTRASASFIVIPADVRAAAAALRVVTDVSAVTQDLQVVVRGPARSMLTPEVIAQHVGLPLAGEYRRERAVELAVAYGEPPARSRRTSLGRLCHRLVTEVTSPPTEPMP